jgi:hypothetical protein
MEGNRLLIAVVIYMTARDILPQLYQFIVVMKTTGALSGVMG